MKWLILVVFQVVGALILTAAAADAATLQFAFSFSNDRQSAGSIVTGLISGLQDNATGAASSVVITSNTAGFGLGEYVVNPDDNRFTVENGVITAFRFLSRGLDNESSDVECCSLGITSNGTHTDEQYYGAGLEAHPKGVAFNYGILGATETLTIVPSPVPLPAAGLLFIAALGSLAMMRRRP